MLREYRFGDFYLRHGVDDCPNDAPYYMHVHEVYEIYLFLSGDVEYLVEGSRYPLKENSLMIMRPSEAHKPRIRTAKRYERYAINFPSHFLTELDPEQRLMRAFTDRPLGKNNMLTGASIDMDRVRECFSRMFPEDGDDYDRQLAIRTQLLTILGMIYRAFRSQERGEVNPRSTAECIVAYVNRHIFEQLSVPELAGHFYLSPSQFTRIFKQATGAAPWEYITIKRLTAAKQQILTGTPAKQSAESCGFKDYSTFYRAYCKYYGGAPSDALPPK